MRKINTEIFKTTENNLNKQFYNSATYKKKSKSQHQTVMVPFINNINIYRIKSNNTKIIILIKTLVLISIFLKNESIMSFPNSIPIKKDISPLATLILMIKKLNSLFKTYIPNNIGIQKSNKNSCFL